MKVILLKDNFLKDENEDDVIYGALLLENDNDEHELKAEHSKLLEENFILNTLVDNYKLKIDVLEKMDANKSLQLNSYKELTENYATQVSDLQKSLKKKQNILKTWKIGCFTIGIGALLYILLK